MNETLINNELMAKNNTNSSYDLVNANSNTTAIDEDLMARNVIIISSYSLIIFISLCGNLLVCKIAFGKKKMRNTTNTLIASLAFSDIVMTTFNIPFNVARLLLPNWPFGSVLCFLVPFIQVSCVYVSTFTMTLIAIHRMWSLTKNTTSRLNLNHSNYRILYAILVIWLLAGTLSLPHSIFNEIKQVTYEGKVLTRCRVTYPALHINFRLLLTVEIFLTQYLLPLLTTTVLYIKIGSIVSRQGKMTLSADNQRRRQQSERKRKRILMLAIIVFVFAICCYNPFIYCWRDDTFREGAQKLLFFTIKCNRNIYRRHSLTTVNSIKYRYNESHNNVETILNRNYWSSAGETLTTSLV